MTEESNELVPMAGWNVTLAHNDERALAELWLDAGCRGWRVTVRPDCQAWSLESPDKVAGAGFDPPGEVCTGLVQAFDCDHTMMLTGVDSHRLAVDHIRDFLNWPAESGVPA